MPRATNRPASRARRKKVLKRAKGFFGSRSKLYRTANESVKRALSFSYRDRRTKKRSMRRLWILRIGAACKNEGISYSRFMKGLALCNVELDRKMLSEMAISDKEGFAHLVAMVKDKVSSIG